MSKQLDLDKLEANLAATGESELARYNIDILHGLIGALPELIAEVRRLRGALAKSVRGEWYTVNGANIYRDPTTGPRAEGGRVSGHNSLCENCGDPAPDPVIMCGPCAKNEHDVLLSLGGQHHDRP
jgi:hypothetical protein